MTNDNKYSFAQDIPVLWTVVKKNVFILLNKNTIAGVLLSVVCLYYLYFYVEKCWQSVILETPTEQSHFISLAALLPYCQFQKASSLLQS